MKKPKRFTLTMTLLQILLPLVPGVYTVWRHPATEMLSPRILIPWMIALDLVLILFCWKRLGNTRRQRTDGALLLLMTACFPWVDSIALPARLAGSLWLQSGFYCLGQAVCFAALLIIPDRFGSFLQRRYEQRVLSGREKFESRSDVVRRHDNEAAGKK